MAEWHETVLSTVDGIVDTSTKKIVRPAHRFARTIVYGLVASLLALIVVFFLVIATFRATTLAVDPYGAYLIWGGIFLAIGALLWAKK